MITPPDEYFIGLCGFTPKLNELRLLKKAYLLDKYLKLYGFIGSSYSAYVTTMTLVKEIRDLRYRDYTVQV